MTQVSDNRTKVVVPFVAGDGRQLNLINIKNPRNVSRGPVIVVHGAGVRAAIFQAPVAVTIVDALIEQGYDVWLENWRASIDFSPCQWTLDEAALYDHPAAVKTILNMTDANELKALIHCQGSTSFTMSVIAGLVPQVTTVVSNAVSLHPIVPAWSKFKLTYLLPIVRLMTEYLDPSWGLETPTLPAKIIDAIVRLSHHECRVAVCKHVSFTYGSGCPALWSHENLNKATHQWLSHEFAAVPLSFFQQITRSIKHKNLVSVQNLPGLPQDFTLHPLHSKTRFAFLAGKNNRCFSAQSQIRSHAYFSAITPDFHSLHIFENYGHLDIFMGKNAATDIFPVIIHELNQGNTKRQK